MSGNRPPLVLIVESDDFLRETYISQINVMVERGNYTFRVLGVPYPEEACVVMHEEQEEDGQLAVLVADLNLAVKDGFDLLLSAQETHPYSSRILVYRSNEKAAEADPDVELVDDYRNLDLDKRIEIAVPRPYWTPEEDVLPDEERRLADWTWERNNFGYMFGPIIGRAVDHYESRVADWFFAKAQEEADEAERLLKTNERPAKTKESSAFYGPRKPNTPVGVNVKPATPAPVDIFDRKKKDA
ncbi:hypothetical protein KY362_00670 [Candidatus Woesearchaeota archaeon]|nr:hypothetical protein [Candidatus Woesearchaeota archaeon]